MEQNIQNLWENYKRYNMSNGKGGGEERKKQKQYLKQ